MNMIDKRLAELRDCGRTRAPHARTLGEIAIVSAAENPDKIVVIEGETQLTRREMLDLALRLGGGLQARGIKPGAVLGFQLPNWWEACVINLAASLFGYRIVPLLPTYGPAELGFILPACGIEALFVPRTYRNTDYAAFVKSLKSPPKHLFVLRDEEVGDNAFETLLEASPAIPSPAQADDAKMILFTSGSTGRPKGVIHTHSTIDSLIRHAADFWDIGPDDTFYIPSPIGQIGGSMYAFEFPWIAGNVCVLAESWNAEQAVQDMLHQEVTLMAAATPFLSGLIEAAEAAATRLPTLRRFICGGASVSPDLVRLGLRTFTNAVVSRAYGSTELPLVCPGVRDRAEAMMHTRTDGECTAAVRLLDDADQIVRAGTVGEVVVRAPRMFAGYLNAKDEEGAFTTDGYFRMGDLGRVVGERFLEITGRKKDMIIRKGENISPLEIENALLSHPAIRQCAVVGIPDSERGEMVVACILLIDEAALTLDDVIAHLADAGMAKQKFPERIEIMQSLPMDAVGKVQKNELRELVEQLKEAKLD